MQEAAIGHQLLARFVSLFHSYHQLNAYKFTGE
jgi:hypothetical protein